MYIYISIDWWFGTMEFYFCFHIFIYIYIRNVIIPTSFDHPVGIPALPALPTWLPWEILTWLRGSETWWFQSSRNQR